MIRPEIYFISRRHFSLEAGNAQFKVRLIEKKTCFLSKKFLNVSCKDFNDRESYLQAASLNIIPFISNNS